MKKTLKAIILTALYFIIPALCVAFNMIFKTAQGEKLEELFGGLIIGFGLDVIYTVILFVFLTIAAHKE